MICIKQLATVALAFVAFALLPPAFWGSIFYWVVSEDAAKAVALLLFFGGLYTCYRGSKNNFKWFNKND